MITINYLRRLLLLMMLLAGVSFIGHAQQIELFSNGKLQGAIKVKLKPEMIMSPAGLKSISQASGYAGVGISNIDNLNTRFKVNRMERLFPYSPKHEAKHQKHGLHLWYKVNVESEDELNAILSAYGQLDEIQVAEPFYQKSLIPHSITKLTEAIVQGPSAMSNEDSPFDDPRFGEQWHYHSTEDNPGNPREPRADINLIKAWETQVGSPEVIVAIIDQGVDHQHEDLIQNMWVNEAELNGTPGEDSDGNGYIDDIYGFNFVTFTGDIDPLDHGTHVGGTVAATNNNGIGISGVAGGSGSGDGVRLMSCMIMSNDANGSAEDAFVYAADNGAVIAQNSWGYNQPDILEESILDAIDYFIEEAGDFDGSPMKGGIVIFAAGNNGEEGNYWPGCYEKVIGVVATDPSNYLSSYSNYGTWADISAPGGDVQHGEDHGVLSTMPGNEYGFYDGTSMACPHVSGIAGLVVSQFGNHNPDIDNFTAEQLWNRLLGGTSVIDTIGYNSNIEGKMGLGAADAYLALLNDEGIAPDPITDLRSEGESSTMALLNWTVPADEDDEKPRFFHVYYYDEPITPENLKFTDKVIQTTSAEAGTTFSYELKNLEANTMYYTVVTGVDRWGNEASMSNQISFTTNNGPIIELNPESIDFSINVGQSKTYDDSFVISNTGEGLLSYNLETYHVNNEDILEDIQDRIYYKTYHGNIIPNVTSSSVESELSFQPFEQKPEERYLYHFDEEWMAYTMVTIGDENIQVPNSAATQYYVNNPIGFNLTGVELALWLERDLLEPAYLEILKGEDIATAELIYRQAFYPDGDLSAFDNVELDHQIFFNQGDVFFVAVHIPPGHLYPLLAAQGYNEASTNYSYYSSDQGDSWKLLKDVYSDDTKVWCHIGMNNYVELDPYIKLDKKTGYLEPGESETISFTVDADSLINGDYVSKIQAFGVGYEEYWKTLDLTFDVTGQTYRMQSEGIVDYGNVFVGVTKEMDIDVSNIGLGAFHSGSANPLSVTISNDAFTPVGLMPTTIQAERSHKFTFLYTPTASGVDNAIVTLTEQNGGTHQFSLFATASMPPKATITPETNYFDDIVLDNDVKGSFTLKNEGAYPLEYYIPRFADGSNMPDFDDKLVHTFGYVAGTSSPAIDEEEAFDWVDISQTGTEVGNKFLLDGSLVFEDALMGFSFPFFGNTFDTCYITNQGAVSFVNEGWFNAKPAGYNSEAQPSKMVSAWGMPFDLHLSGDIYYQAFPGKFIIQYEQVSHGSYFYDEDEFNGVGWLDEPITFQIVLHQSGDIDFFYKDLGAVINDLDIGFNRAYALVSIEDYDLADLLVLNGYGTYEDDPFVAGYAPTTGDAVYFKNPGRGAVQEVTNAYGTIPVNSSVEIEYTVITDSLYVGNFDERVNVVTTDPINNPVTHTINLNITSGGDAEFVFDVDTVDFGDIFKGGVYSQNLVAGNDGRAIGYYEGVVVQNERFTIDGYMPVELHPGNFSDYTVTVNAEGLGPLSDLIIFKTAEGEEVSIPVKCNVIEAPFISSDKESISETLNYGEDKVVKIEVSNTGNNPMEVTPSGTEWLKVSPSDDTDYVTGQDYSYSIDYNEGSEFYTPSNVMEVGDKWEGPEEPLDPETYWNAFPLPFEIPFYGESYDTIYIAINGVMTFIPDQEATEMGPIYYIPNTEGIQGFLAPMYCIGGLSYPEYYPETGIYTHAYDDKYVVRYQDMSSFSGGSTASVEVWMFRDGTIKYMFDVPEHANCNVITGIVGIQNQDGTQGLQVSANTKGVIFDKTVITFTPQDTYEIKANSSKYFDVNLNANSIFGGDYETDLVFANNTPLNPDFSIPVSLSVIGNDSIVISDTLHVGELYIAENPDEDSFYSNLYYDFNFTVRNEGSNPLEINRIMFNNGFNLGMIMGDKNKFGDPEAEDEWVDIESNWINYTIRPNNAETFNLRIMPVNPEAIADVINIQCNVEGGFIQIPVSAEFRLPPVISADQTKISVTAKTTEDEQQRQFSFKNVGASTLSYDLGIGFEDPYSDALDIYSLQEYNFYTSSAEKPTIKTFENSGAQISTFDNGFDRDDFNSILEHEQTESSQNALGFNGDLPLSTATAFTALEAGFNLSHVTLWYNYGEELTSEIKVEIRGGHNNFFNTEVLHSYTYTHEATESTEYGNFITIDLEEQLFFYPKEKFYVVLYFEQKVLYPQGISQVPSAQLDRFYYGDGSFFVDGVNAGFGTLAWMVKAVEIEPSDNFWVMIDSEKEGTLEPGEETTVDLTFASIFALQGKNEALVQISSNDPLDSLVSVPVELYQNMGPAYPDGADAYFSVYEMDTMLYRLRPYDPDGDEFTVKVLEDKPYFEYTQEGNDINFYFTPDYDGEGDHFIEVEGEDEHGNKSKFTLNISVMNLNRAPIVHEEIGEKVFPLESDEGIYMDLTDYISDPDEDPLEFEVFYSSTDVLSHMQDGSAVVFTPRKLGDINITIKATDIYGASVDTDFMAFVEHRIGIDDNEGSRLAIYPNPVTDLLRIYTNASESVESLVQVYTAAGEEILRQEFILNNEHVLDLKHLAAGVYILKLTQGEKVTTKKITKI